MAALEREGYLTHPHTSAGRIPTDKGYRFFVDHLGNPQPLAQAEHEKVQASSPRHTASWRRSSRTPRGCSPSSPTAPAVVVGPAHEALVVRSALLRGSRRIRRWRSPFSPTASWKSVPITLRDDLPDAVLSTASIALQQRLSGSSLWFVPPEIVERRCTTSTTSSAPASSALEDGGTALGDDQVFVGGAASWPSASTPSSRSGPCSGSSSSPYVVVTLLRDVLAQGESVSIGSEHAAIESLAECSLVVAPYESEGVALGTMACSGRPGWTTSTPSPRSRSWAKRLTR